MRIRTYKELMSLSSFEERFDYLQLNGVVGHPTFGYERYLNQRFYTSTQWKKVRRDVIARDYGLDLGVDGYEIHDRVIIHHMNPMAPSDLHEITDDVLNPDFLITTCHQTHNAIHYGDSGHLRPTYVARKPGDTKLW